MFTGIGCIAKENQAKYGLVALLLFPMDSLLRILVDSRGLHGFVFNQTFTTSLKVVIFLENEAKNNEWKIHGAITMDLEIL